jgi:ribosomal protein S27E
MECDDCGNVAVSPDGRDAGKLEELCELIVEMDLRCLKCGDGFVVARVAPAEVAP